MIRHSMQAFSLRVFVGSFGLALAAQVVERVSIGPGGAQGNDACNDAAVSADGRYVAFSSRASNLVASDTNGNDYDIFVRDRVLQTTQLVSVSSSGAQSANFKRCGAISQDGRYVAFLADGLASTDADTALDVYVRDLQTGVTKLIAAGPDWTQYGQVSLSADGHRVAFEGNLNNDSFAFVVDHVSGQSWTWTAHEQGQPWNSDHYYGCVISGDGRWVFMGYRLVDGTGLSGTSYVRRFDTQTSTSTNFLVGAHTPNPVPSAVSFDGRFVVAKLASDIVVCDTATSAVDVATPTVNGAVLNGYVWSSSISADGRYIAYASDASNLVAGDTNGTWDAFVYDRLSHVVVRVSEDALGAQGNGASTVAVLTSDASSVVFTSGASNLVSADTNAFTDVFTRTNCFPHWVDADGDGYGASGAPQLVCFPATGMSLNALDCDDADAARHPGNPDVPNGIDDDCNGSIDEGVAYCTAGTSANGCVPQISASGAASASATSGYSIDVQFLPGQRNGLILYGLTPAATPWGTSGSSFSCIAAPRQRTSLAATAGTSGQCNGQLSLDVSSWWAANPASLGSPVQAGQTRYFQAWYRDPGVAPNSRLTGGWQVVFGP